MVKTMAEMNNTWKVIYCASRQEKKVSAYLTQRSIEHYLPLVNKLRIWSDRKKWVEMPLFNAYIFVRPTEVQRDLVLQVPGVVKYLRYNGKDAHVPDRDVALIQRLIEKGYQIQQHDMSTSLKAGDLAEVLDGPFKGEEVEVHYSENEVYVIVSVEGFSNSYKVNLPREVLKLKKKNKDREKALW
jgi:transcription antitermination factor NusG